ncbi:MAG: hypothetical protein K8L99_03165 [Anaerolineae bacterium]|nr:hypothetical protein [Anaerolineae bacterium]
MAPTLDQYPQRDALFTVTAEGVIAHNRYEDRVIRLDALSSEIWLRADGKTSLRDIVYDIAGVANILPKTLLSTAAMLVVLLNSEGVLYQKNHPDALPYHLSLPQEDQDIEQMFESLAAAGWLDEE